MEGARTGVDEVRGGQKGNTYHDNKPLLLEVQIQTYKDSLVHLGISVLAIDPGPVLLFVCSFSF